MRGIVAVIRSTVSAFLRGTPSTRKRSKGDKMSDNKTTIMERVAILFAKSSVPSGAKKVFDEAKNPEELISGLERLMNVNEGEVNKIEASIDLTETLLGSEEGRVRAGMGPRLERAALLKVKRVRKQLSIHESLLRIHEKNLDLLQTLVGKIREVQAMRLSGIDETKIDEILLAYEESRDAEEERDISLREGLTEASSTKKEDEELARLKAELLGTPIPEPRAEIKEEKKTEVRAPALPPRRSIDEPRLIAPPTEEVLDELDRELAAEDRELDEIMGKVRTPKRKALEP